jgi:hypothetical protein
MQFAYSTGSFSSQFCSYGTSPQDSAGIRVRQPFKNSLGTSSVHCKEVSPLLQPRQLMALSPSPVDSGDDFVMIADSSAVVEQEWHVSCPLPHFMFINTNAALESASCCKRHNARHANAHQD